MTKGTVKIRGIRSPIPSGHLVGRTDTGAGDGHLVKAGRALTLGNRRLDVTLSGDVKIDQKGDATVVGLQGVPVDNAAPSINDVLTFDGSTWGPAVGSGGTGDVVGPASAVNNHVAFFDGTTGKLIKDSGLTLSGSNTGDQTISDATISTTDITTNNVSITKHGFAPKAPNDATKYLDGTGVYTVPAGSGTYTDEQAQDAVGAMVDGTLVYVDATPLLTRAALTGDITAPQASNATTLATVNSNVGSFTNANITVNAKGLITAAANGSGGGGSKVKYGSSIAWTASAQTFTAGYALGISTIIPNGGTIDGVGFLATAASASTTWRVAVYSDNADVINALQQQSNLRTGVVVGINYEALTTPYTNSSGAPVIVWLVVVAGVANFQAALTFSGGTSDYRFWNNSGTTLPSTAATQTSATDHLWIFFAFGNGGT